MRSTVVPAQVTTVEDRIVGSLGLSQLLLLSVPVFLGSALFVILPPFFSYATYKVVVIAGIAGICGLLAIRLKGKILLLWIIALARYNLRPRYYVFDKNTAYARDNVSYVKNEEPDEVPEEKKIAQPELPALSTADLVRVEHILSDPQANLHITANRKGEFSVRITEIQ